MNSCVSVYNVQFGETFLTVKFEKRSLFYNVAAISFYCSVPAN
jgi:hypothetical protein